MTTRYSLDIDGVVANYREGIRNVMHLAQIPSLTQPVGLEPAELDMVMQQRQEDMNTAINEYVSSHLRAFFGQLSSLVTPEDMSALHASYGRGYELFWVSSRGCSGTQIKQQPLEQIMQITLNWLTAIGLPTDRAHLLITPDKAQTIRANHIRYHLDDLVPYATQVAFNSEAQVYLLRQPWNRRMIFRHPDQAEYTAEIGAFGIPEVDSIAEYIGQVTGRPE